MTRSLWALALAFVCGCGSAETPTQTIIRIDAGDSVRAATARLAVDIRSLSGSYHEALTPDPVWPLKFVLAPEHEDASRRFAIEVAVLDQESNRLVAFSLASGFRHGGAAYAELLVDDSCLDDSNACTSMDCNSKSVAGDALGRTREHALVVHVDCAPLGSNVDMPQAGAGSEPDDRDAGSGGEPTAGAPRTQTGHAMGGMGGAAGSGADAGRAGDAAAGSDAAPDGCDPGYERVGSDCVDLDECASMPCGHGQCMNQPGGYTCTCDAGYHVAAGSCASDDPCAKDNGGCSGSCTNVSGQAQCTCPSGGWLKSDAKSCARLDAPVKLSLQGSLLRAQPQVTFDGQGRAWAVWIQGTTEDGLALWSARAEPGQDFGAATKLPLTKIAPVRAPRIAVSPDGASTRLLWLQPNSDQTSLQLWAASSQNGAWDAPTRIDGGFGAVSEPVLALDKNGAAVATWMETQGSRYQVWMSRWSNTDHAWGDAYHLAGTDTVDAWWPRLSLDEKSGGALVWTQMQVVDGKTDPTTASLWGARLNLTSTADPTSRLLAATSAQADVAIKPDGSGLLVWLGYVDQAFAVLANGYRPGLGLGPATPSSLRSLEAATTTEDMQRFPLAPRVALSSQGDGVAMWVELRDSTSAVWGATYDATGGAWSMSQVLSPQQSVSPGWTDPVLESVFALALDAHGDGITVWSDFATDFKRDVWLQPVHAKTGFLDRVHVVTSDSVPKQSSRVEAAVNSEGHGFVIWDVQQDSRYEVWASRLE